MRSANIGHLHFFPCSKGAGPMTSDKIIGAMQNHGCSLLLIRIVLVAPTLINNHTRSYLCSTCSYRFDSDRGRWFLCGKRRGFKSAPSVGWEVKPWPPLALGAYDAGCTSINLFYTDRQCVDQQNSPGDHPLASVNAL